MQLKYKLHQAIEAMWWAHKKPNIALRGLSHIYQTCSQYDQQKRLAKSITPALPIISIGNITVGGSGKTPFTAWLAQALQQYDFKPVILCRGDGGKHGAAEIVNHASKACDVGDEALLLHKITGLTVISAQDRVQASRMASQYGNIILLDDGFQYRQLQRQCDIVLVPSEGLGNGYLLPAGPLRELPEALQRAHIIVRTGSKPSNQTICSNKQWCWLPSTDILRDWMHHQQTPPCQCIALSAIARPQRFIDSLKKIGLQVQKSYLFPDHHTYSKADLKSILASKLSIITTAKDAVKLQEIWPRNRPLWVLEQNFKGEKGLLEAIIFSLKIAR